MPPATDPQSLLRLAAIALSVAALPLGLWWLRQRDARSTRRLAALTALTLFFTFDLVVVGAFTRLSDSGLGCPDWPGCYGSASPLGASDDIALAQAERPQGPVTHGKAWIEMLHRYLAMAVGVLIISALWGAWRHRRALPHSPGWPAATLAWVIVQGLFGKYTVTLKLFPAIVTLHLLGALGLLGLLAIQHESFRTAQAADALPRGLRHWAAIALTLLLVQVTLGGWVSTNYAVLACQGFPACNGQAWPDIGLADLARGFTPWRALGHTAEGRLLPFDALVAIHWVHRLFAAVAALALLGLAVRLRRWPAWRRSGGVLAALVLLQLAIGLSNVVLRWPLAGALLHTAGAAALTLVLVRTLARSGLVLRRG